VLTTDVRLDTPQCLKTTDQDFCPPKTLATFKYRPISDKSTIRIIALQPGTKGSAIQCTLSDFDLDTLSSAGQGSFETLSYVWGDAQNLEEIICDGAPINVTKSLYEALQVLRYPVGGGARFLW
jgi:hypothetical protein